LGKEKQWFYANKEVVSIWEKCTNVFLTKFFLLGKTNALRNKISSFQQLTDETIADAWECLQDYFSVCPHHEMQEWFGIQSDYHRLIRSAREHIDADARGSLFALSVKDARALIEKVASSQSWNDEYTQSRTHKVHQLEEVDMLTTKIDLLMKKLEDSGLDHHRMVDSHMMYEECGETGCMGINFPATCQDMNFVQHSNEFCPNQFFNSGWNKLNFSFDNR
jgi:hypothetical protein